MTMSSAASIVIEHASSPVINITSTNYYPHEIHSHPRTAGGGRLYGSMPGTAGSHQSGGDERGGSGEYKRGNKSGFGGSKPGPDAPSNAEILKVELADVC